MTRRSLLLVVSALVVPTATLTPVHAAPAASYTAAQVAAHATAGDCWSIVNGKVYDLTSWIAQHPGGPSPIKSMCGKDATAAFNAQHASTKAAQSMLATFQIGTLATAAATASSTTKPSTKPVKKTISCTKGSKKRTVTAAAPRCPSGWKQARKARTASLRAGSAASSSRTSTVATPGYDDDDWANNGTDIHDGADD